jgi:hypothetical protein
VILDAAARSGIVNPPAIPPMNLSIVCIASLLLIANARAADNEPPEGFKALFNGKDLSGWAPVNVAPDTYTVRDGMIIISGVPTGYMRTDQMHENFILECDWRHMQRGGNSGVFIWGDGVPAKGTGYTRGIEVQVLDEGFNPKGKNVWYTCQGDIFPIWGATMTPWGRISNGGKGDRSFPIEDRTKSSPEWNHYHIECNAGEIHHSINGKEVTVAKDCVPRKGFIALESEGSECHFKNTPSRIPILDRSFMSYRVVFDVVQSVPAEMRVRRAKPYKAHYTLTMRAAFRFLPYCYFALALVCAIPASVVIRSIISVYQPHDEDALFPSKIVAMFTFAFLAITFAVAFLTNAVLLLRRRRRELSLVLGGLACLVFPFGTALGAVSIFLLTRDDIRIRYDEFLSISSA